MTIDQFAAFVIPNNSFKKTDDIRLIDYVVKIKDLEAVTGLTFFPTNSPTSSERTSIVAKY